MHRITDGNCFYCGTFLTRACGRQIASSKTRDQVEPRCKGGYVTVDCCFSCNQDKHSLTLQEYRLVIMYRRGLIRKEMVEGGILFWGEKS